MKIAIESDVLQALLANHAELINTVTNGGLNALNTMTAAANRAFAEAMAAEKEKEAVKKQADDEAAIKASAAEEARLTAALAAATPATDGSNG